MVVGPFSFTVVPPEVTSNSEEPVENPTEPANKILPASRLLSWAFAFKANALIASIAIDFFMFCLLFKLNMLQR